MKFKEYTKVSIHNHLGGMGADRKIDDDYTKNCNFDMKMAEKWIDEANDFDFRLIALTQANRLPAKEYREIKKYGEGKGVNVLPGVEINLKNGDKILHTVVVFDDDSKVEEIETSIDNKIYDNKSNFLTIEQFLNLIIDYKCIICAHGIKQNDRSAASNPDMFSELINISDSIPVVIEDNHKYHKETLKLKLRDKLTSKELEWLDNSSTLSSADRLSFREIKSPTYIWGTPTFDDLYYSCFMSDTRIKRETDIINKVNYISKIVIDKKEDSQLKPVEITCSHGLNSIIGSSGSGKTLLLDIIKRKLTGEALDNKTISSNCDYQSIYNLSLIHLYDKEGNEIDNHSGYTVVEGEILYNKVISAYQADRNKLLEELNLKFDVSVLDPIINEFNNDLNKYIKDKIIINQNIDKVNMLIRNIDSAYNFLNANQVKNNETIEYCKDDGLYNKIITIDTNLVSFKNDINTLNSYIKEIRTIVLKYDPNNKFDEDLSSLNKKIVDLIIKKELTSKIDRFKYEDLYFKQKLIHDTSLRYNELIGSQFKAILEKKQEIVKYFSEIVEIIVENVKLSHNLFIPVLDASSIKKAMQFKDTSVAQMTFKNVKLKILKNEFKTYFPNNVGNSPKVRVSLFDIDELNLNNKDDVEKFANVFISQKYGNKVEFSITNGEFVDYNIELKNLNGTYENIDSISAGNLSKIYINKMFEEKILKSGSDTIVLYDQPDTNMEKIFILDELVKKLSTLRNSNQIFITTHEPLLVVNADSNNIILAKNNKTASKLNDIEYSNKSFVGVNSHKSLLDEVAKLIDGKPEAVELRSTLYGGILNEN